MPVEIELKLRIPPAQAPRLARHPLLGGLSAQRKRLLNTYFDTPDLALRRRGVALRHRQQGRAWLMTVKGGDPAAGALARRSEWEAPTAPGEFDFGIVTDARLREFLEAQRPRLTAVFTTDFTRLAWTIERGGSTLELALDRGRIEAAGAAPLKLCEVEIEQISGDSLDPLFELALELAGEFHLHPEIASKAERGYGLFTGATMTPVKAGPSPLAKKMRSGEAFGAAALACLGHLQRNEEGVIAGGDPEFLHQARVAIRRLRSVHKLFAPCLPPDFLATYDPRWRELAARFGAARDWDVFLAETLAPLEAQFPETPALALIRDRGRERSALARKAVRDALREPDYSRLLLAYTADLFRLPEAGDGKLRRFALSRLRRCHKKVCRMADSEFPQSAEQRHQLRISFKRLRYATDYFAPLLPHKRTRAWLKKLADLQNLLGQANDLATAASLTSEFGDEFDLALLRGWITGRQTLLIDALPAALKRFCAKPAPWD